MQLKSLEIMGFKSFADKTKLNLSEGITAVVGPNGSGKSNISDAVRWVLGEQSTKTLRGQKMEDIIFGGTQNRKPMGYASVALTMDNRSRELPIDADEVTISRKLYRSGDSEYRINNVAVRLRDVNEMLMDTGMGRDGYSIIGQGKIAEIVSAKSGERREIFEEAAGISKFRYRKGEAQKQLDQAQENLLRLKDILMEIEGRIEPLRIQSQKAAEFLEYADEKKTLEVSLWLKTIEHSKEQLQEQEEKLLICKNSHDDVQAVLNDIEIQIQQIYEKIQQCSIELEAKRQDIASCEAQLSGCDSAIAVYKNDIFHNEDTIHRLQRDLSASSEDLSVSKTRQDENEQKLTELQQLQIERQQHLEEITETSSALREATHHDQSVLKTLQAQEMSYRQELANQQLLQASSSSLLEAADLQMDALMKSQAAQEETGLTVQKELDECRDLIKEIDEQLVSLENSRQGVRMMVQSRQQELDKILASQKEILETARLHQQRAKLLSDMERNMEGFANSVKFVMKQAESGRLKGVHGPVSTLFSTENRLTTAIEIALGGALQNVVVDNEYTAKTAIQQLKNGREGRVTFLPLTTIHGKRLDERGLEQCDGFIGIGSDLVRCEERYGEIAKSLLGRTVVVEDIDRAIALSKKYSHRFRVVTLDGQLVNAGGSMTGGYIAKKAGIMNRKTEIDALQQQAKACEEQAQAMQPQIKSAEEKIAAFKAKDSSIEAQMQTMREDRIHAQAEEKRLSMAVREAQEQAAAAKREQEATQKRLDQLRQQSDSSGAMIEKVTELLGNVLKEIQQLEERTAHKTKEETMLAAQENQEKMELLALSKDIEALLAAQQQLQQQLNNQSIQSQSLRSQIDERQRSNEAIAQQITQKEAEKEQIAATIQQDRQTMEQLLKQRELFEGETTSLRKSEKDHLQTREKIAAELSRLEEKRISLQTEYDSIISRLYDEYSLTRSQAAEIAVEISDKIGVQKRITELKNKIKNLGSVNLGAIEEYKEVSERYTFMKSQIDDVEQSKAQLQTMIADLTSEMEEMFSASFTQINEHFSTIFVELFGGGRASLSLSDPEHVLDSGIDIAVQPPGKIIKNLTALSGGEQALVAIAIYFAILKVRPAPFCLLDEIEAALDEVNVTRYADYLRKMSGRTQFIAITHRRGTMEEADVLYGVTMQEEGISKLLELNVSQVESKLGI